MTTAPTATCTGTTHRVHSVAEFAVKHMMRSTVKERSRTLAGTRAVDQAGPPSSRVTVEIDVASIDTDEPQRVAHPRSDDVTGAQRFPRPTFRSTESSARATSGVR